MNTLIEWLLKKVKGLVVSVVYFYLVAIHYFGPWIVNGVLLLSLYVIYKVGYKLYQRHQWKKKCSHPKWIKDLSKQLEELDASKVVYGEGWIEVIVLKRDKGQAANITRLAIGNRPEEYIVREGLCYSHSIKEVV